MRFDFPAAFVILPLIPALLILRFARSNGRVGVGFSSTEPISGLPRSLRQRLMFVPSALRVAALALVVVALARPQFGTEQIRDISEGIAIYMVVDRSGSMAAEMQTASGRMNRLQAVKRVFAEFVLGDAKGLSGRPNDLVGMVSFARYADTICPLTLSHSALRRFIDATNLVERESEDGTAIGDAIALAAARLETAEQDLARRGGIQREDYTIKSKIIILLTDGENNAGKRSPTEAARLAAEWGIRIYTIGIGGRENYVTIRTPLGVQKIPVRSDIDERTLESVASITDGKFFRADDVDSLREVYADIDRLEKTQVETVRYRDYREAFLPFALAAFIMLALEVLLSSTVFRRIP